MSGCRENFPRVQDYDTFLIYQLFFLKCVFLNNSGAFKDFGIFVKGNVRLKV